MSISQSNYLAHLSHAATTLYTQIHNRVTGILIFNDCSPHFPSIPPTREGNFSASGRVLAIQSNSKQATRHSPPPPHRSSHFILLTFPFFPLFKYLISPRWYIDTIYSSQRERDCAHTVDVLCAPINGFAGINHQHHRPWRLLPRPKAWLRRVRPSISKPPISSSASQHEHLFLLLT